MIAGLPVPICGMISQLRGDTVSPVTVLRLLRRLDRRRRKIARNGNNLRAMDDSANDPGVESHQFQVTNPATNTPANGGQAGDQSSSAPDSSSRKRTSAVLLTPLLPSHLAFNTAKAPSVRRACVACHTGKTRCSEVLPCQVSHHASNLSAFVFLTPISLELSQKRHRRYMCLP
jgi:hypothetical protein